VSSGPERSPDSQQGLRNAIHLATGAAAGFVVAVPRSMALAILGTVLILALALDLARRRPGCQAWLDRRLPGVYRADEFRGLSGATLLVAGYLIAVAAFPARAAAAGIVALAVGDPAASLAGRWYQVRLGPETPPGKTWVGSLACFLAASLALWALPWVAAGAAAAGGAMAALIERRAGRLDNLLVPVGVAMLLNLWVA
jgi:dolichol kinase